MRENVITRQIVKECYLRYLGRMPESEVVIEEKLIFDNIIELEKSFTDSAEYNDILKDYRVYTTENIQSFVDEVDYLGGWGSPRAEGLVKRFRFHRGYFNEDIDPYSDEWFEKQIQLYTSITGIIPNQEKTELTTFDLEAHLNASNSYAHIPTHMAAMHAARISIAFMHSKLHQGSLILDMGCGWGLSSELIAFFDSRVLGVDINPQFCELVNRRAEAKGLPIAAKLGTFEYIPSTELFDGVFYYESLHHAQKLWSALEASFDRLKVGGRLVLAGEPINDMWKNWGLRTDAESLYVMKKFGWFESGWSLKFLEDCIIKVGYKSIEKFYYNHSIGWIVIATK